MPWPCCRPMSCEISPRDNVSKSRLQRAFAVERFFPVGTKSFETRGGGTWEDLFPSERNCVVKSVDKRVREFAAGRLCARAGLIELGIEPVPLPVGLGRMPVWPLGIVGSITHTDGYCAAVVGLETQFAAVGLDAANIGDMCPKLWRLVLHAQELRKLESLEEAARQPTATVIFSAKEAFYKCQYAITRCWLGFKDVVVDIEEDVFQVSVVDTSHPICKVSGSWAGRFRVRDTLVTTGIAHQVEK